MIWVTSGFVFIIPVLDYIRNNSKQFSLLSSCGKLRRVFNCCFRAGGVGGINISKTSPAGAEKTTNTEDTQDRDRKKGEER